MEPVMNTLYPPGPENLPEGLTKPTASYKRHAWLAMLGLVVFVVFYNMLMAWFGWTAYRLMYGAFETGGNKVMGIITGIPAVFLALFMVKAIIFVKRGLASDDIELTAESEPELFKFIYQLADEAGAPRPHKVYISPRVNAAVFYNLTIFNFFFPSKKNLEIGIGLVNILTLGELKAVLAHEFGHFAQRSMAVGNWVYLAHQIAAHIIAHRDIFDRFIHGLSRFDFRIAWIGWILRLLIWSIRSLIETVFSLVVMAQRALSREMEFQADLVAVSMTGSDALIHALHKLNSADEAWNRTIGFINEEASDGRMVKNAFTIQKLIISRLSVILNDPYYGKVPPLPETKRETYRLFKTAQASPPEMWATHPENSSREENAKKIYIAASVDERSAWAIFKDKDKICTEMSAALLDGTDLSKPEMEETITNLDKQFKKAYLAKIFRGVYLGRSITRYASDVSKLYGDYQSLKEKDIDSNLAAIYPKALTAILEKLIKLNEEKHILEGIEAKTLTLNGGTMRHRDKEIKPHEVPRIIESVKKEIAEVNKKLQGHDMRCRTVHLALASRAGNGWEENVRGLLSLIHYADHSEANLRDVHGYLANTVAVVTADDRVSKREMKRLLIAANATYAVLSEIYEKAGQVEIGRLVGKQLEIDNWKEALGELELLDATKDNISEWMTLIDGWVNVTFNALSSLSSVALEQLLKVEFYLSKFHKEKKALPAAPKAPLSATDYSTLLEGNEREIQTKLSLWDRFYRAEGFIPATLRFSVAASIVGVMIYVGQLAGAATLTIYNGLTQVVKVNISGQETEVLPFSYQEMKLERRHNLNISSTIKNGIVDSFVVEKTGSYGDYVYNIANASPLIEWTQVYGNAKERPDRLLGAPRWIATSAQVLFKDPPEDVKTKSGGATRTVLEAYSNGEPYRMLKYVKNADEKKLMIRQHVVWDKHDSRFLQYWMRLASNSEDMIALSNERLKHYNYDIMAMRLLQDYAPDEDAYNAVCDKHAALAKQNPEIATLSYLAIRCISDEKKKNLAYINEAKKWPRHDWFHLAAGYSFVDEGNWVKATSELSEAMKLNDGFKERLATDVMRLHRLQGNNSYDIQNKLSSNSVSLWDLLRLENGDSLEASPFRFYSLLNKGDLKGALIAAKEMDGEQARSIRLMAASDGATSEIIKELKKLSSEDGIDSNTVWLAWSHAIKNEKDATAFENTAYRMYRNAPLMLKILHKVHKKGAYRNFEKDMYGMSLLERGLTYSTATILAGKRAGKSWKKKANSLLFATERPYFKTAGR